MPVKDDYTCMLILDEIIHTCGLCDTEKEAIRYAIDQMERDETDGMDELYGNNSLGGFQQRESPKREKEEREKGPVEVIMDKLRKRKGRRHD